MTILQIFAPDERPEPAVDGAAIAALLPDFAAAVAAVDGVAPFNEATMLRPEERRAFSVVREAELPDSGRRARLLVGLALAQRLDDGELEAELAVHPTARGAGVADELLDGLERAAGGAPVTVWAHGDLPAARVFAANRGYALVRTLLVLAKPLDDALPEPAPAPGTRIRAFDPERDADAWLALNARVFADHPEQGRLRRADLDDRMAQPWFDAGDFLVLVDDDERMIGYNWCKVAGGEHEIYVVGVDPDAAGAGHGRTLMDAGLRRLRERGGDEAVLYVDGGNERAVALYRRLGFVDRARDAQYRGPR